MLTFVPMKQGAKHSEKRLSREAELLQKNEELASENRSLANKVIHLEEQLDWLKRQLFGKKSERFVADKESLPELDLFPEDTQSTDIQPDNKKEQAKETITYQRQKSKRKPVRTSFPAHLRREVETIIIENLPDGSVKIGEYNTEILEYSPAEIFVRKIVRERYVVKKQKDVVMEGETTIISASMPSQPFPRSNFAASLVAYFIVAKFVDHLPFYRQVKQFKRHDIELSESTINDSFVRACQLLEPLYETLKKELLKLSYNQADEVPIPVQTKDKPGATHKGYLWAYHSPPEKLALFEYQKGRSGEFPREFLKDFTGILQTDGYSGYDQFSKNQNITLAACMAHARRKFVEAAKSYAHIADYVLEQIQQLYIVEREIRDKQLLDRDIVKLRTEISAPILTDIENYLHKHQKEVLPQSTIGKAITYYLNHADRLKTYLTHPMVQIDNNLIENSIRPIVLGRKNYLFAGSHEAAQRAAMMYSFFACCHLNNVNPYKWLTDVLNRISDHKANKLKELLPNYWTELNQD